MTAPLVARALRREPVERTPVWFMRQAGRMLPEYREVRRSHTLVQICGIPDLCAEVTLQPMRRFAYDAAVMFADIMLPLIAVGVEIELVDGVGPVVEQPFVGREDLRRLRPIEPADDVAAYLEAIAIVRRDLEPERAVLGFAGAPFTLASYLIEGRPSRDYARVKTLMHAEPALFGELMARLAELQVAYLRAQVEAGADAVQLFDSWVGALSPADYARHVQPHTRAIFAGLADLGVPMIHFGTGCAGLLPQMATDGATALGVDWRIPLDVARAVVGDGLALQGNLDPAALLAPPDALAPLVREVLAAAAGAPGHVFNLGHGLMPQTPLHSIPIVIDTVRAETAR